MFSPRNMLQRIGSMFTAQPKEGSAPTLAAIGKNSSLARSQRNNSISLSYFEGVLRGAVVKFVAAQEGTVKHTHGFAAFWLRFSKVCLPLAFTLFARI